MSLRTSSIAAISGLPDTLRGALWMIGASAAFAGMNGAIRYVSGEMHPFEIAFFRNLFGFLLMAPWLVTVGFGGLRTKRLGLYTLRSIFGISAMLAWFWSLSVMKLADAVALSFTLPLFATILAALVLKEVVRIRRWTATIIGFAGAMIILRPGIDQVTQAEVIVLFAALMMAMAAITVKTLARTESTNAIVMYMLIFMTPLSAIPAAFVWTTPSWDALLWMVVIGALANLAHICLTRAFKAAEASAVMPYDFFRLIFAAAVGYVFFSEVADVWTWVGAAIIAGSSVYIAHREARVARATRIASEVTAQSEGK